jgi:hypothetical protein
VLLPETANAPPPGCDAISTPARRSETAKSAGAAVPPSSLTTVVATLTVDAPSSSVTVHVLSSSSARATLPLAAQSPV